VTKYINGAGNIAVPDSPCTWDPRLRMACLINIGLLTGLWRKVETRFRHHAAH